MNPKDCIVPLLALNDSGGSQAFCGTASFVIEKNLLLTAEHVVRDWDRDFGFVILPDLSCIHRAKLIRTDAERDLALLRTTQFQAKNALQLREPSATIASNETILCFEYGTTIQAGNEVLLNPATRVGNMTRQLDMTATYKTAGKEMLELSFPALKGASGAPVVSNNKRDLLGMVVANVSYHLLPAQITTVHDETGQIEEQTQFMLPQGLAVNVEIIREFLEDGKSHD